MQRLILFYIVFLLTLGFFTYLFVDSNLIYLKDLYTGFYTNHRNWISFSYLILLVFQFFFYFLFLKKIRSSPINLKFLILITSLVLLFSYPAMLSYDIFNYVTTSKVVFGYHENPYIFQPAEFAGEPFLQFTRASNKIALYGPAWIIASAVPFFLGFGNFILTLFGFKLVAMLSYLGSSFLIFKITKNTYSTALFALNPLVVDESLISAHNDIFMMFFALLSFFLLSKGEKLTSLGAIFISIMVKYATLFLIPIFTFSLWELLKKRRINLSFTYLIASLSMLAIFTLSFFREEIYSWYGIWFLIFSVTIPNKKLLLYLSFGLSIGLMLSYLPFMFSGNYFGSTPYLKYALLVLSTVLTLFIALRRRLWLKNFWL